MVKRGSVEDGGEDRGRLLTEVEQLVSSGDNTMVCFYGPTAVLFKVTIYKLHIPCPYSLVSILLKMCSVSVNNDPSFSCCFPKNPASFFGHLKILT